MVVEAEITIPNGVTFERKDNLFIAKGSKGTVEYLFKNPKAKVELLDGKIKISILSERKNDRALINTWSTIIKNMITGVTVGFEYNMKLIYSHFPVTLDIKNNVIEIKNFLGEKGSRRSKILGDTKVQVQKEDIKLTGSDKYKIGQTAANLEQACKIKGKDRRIFQDGIYITKKP